MRFVYVLSLGLLALVLHCDAYSAYSVYERPGYSSSSSSSSRYTSSSSYSSSYGGNSGSSSISMINGCCDLNSWAYNHLGEVRQFASRLIQEFNAISRDTASGLNYNTSPWNADIVQLCGKTASELDIVCRQLGQQIVNEMRSGRLSYATISQPNFFEWQAAKALQNYAISAGTFVQQQQQQQQQLLDIGHLQPVDLTNFDEVKNYAYPAEVKVIDGKTYVVHKNCTEATRNIGTGTFDNPHVSIIKRNRTIITTSNVPAYTSQVVYGGGMGAQTSGSLVNYQPTSGYTVTTQKKTIHDWIRENMEPRVVGYNPQVNIIGNDDGGRYGGSTKTITSYNKTITTHPDGTNSVSGSESQQRWINGQLVYDTQRPFGEWSVPRDEAWKREERERFFWFLTQGATTAQQLEAWQRQQEERLLAMAQRYQTSVENIQQFHRDEMERYRLLLGQYQAQLNDASQWQRVERGRLDWLIHQNSLTREEFERWQRENNDKLLQLSRQYRISVEELKRWQLEELNRLYKYFNDVNNSMISRPGPDSSSLVVDDTTDNSEQQRLNELIRQHNETIAKLQQSIHLDQQKLGDLATKYRGNVQDMDKWLKQELSRISGLISQQNTEMTRITEWQNSERQRMETILRQHQGSVNDLQHHMEHDRNYIQSLAARYKVSIEELERWQREELARLQREGQSEFEANIKAWQLREQQRLRAILAQNDLTIEEFQKKATADRAHIEQLARDYNVQVHEIEEWIKNETKRYKSEGLLKEVEQELALWQQRERERLQSIVGASSLTVNELELKIKQDQSHLYELANKYQITVEEVQEWLKKELLRLQSEGLVKVEDLKNWQQNERAEIMKLVQQNRFTIEEFELKLLTDRQHLQDLSKTYNVQVSEIEKWIQSEGERLQNLGLLKMQEQLNNWQKIEKQRIIELLNKNNLSIDELEAKIKQDQVHLYSLAHQHQVRVEEIEDWVKKEIKRLQAEGLIEIEKLKNWQLEWRGNLTNMVQERDFTVEEFHKWLLEDRARLQNLAMQHNVQIEEIEDFVKREEQRFVSMGLLKPNEKLTNWQQAERMYLGRLAEQQYKSTEQLEARLRQDRELLEQLARQYSVQVEEIEEWMKKELARLRDDGKLQIENLTSWQIAERERLEELVKQNKQWSTAELEAVLRKDREHMQTMAFQYHTSVEEIEKWVQSEIDRLKQQGKLNIEQLTAWQKAEHQRILSLLEQQSSITIEEFELKVQKDRRFLMNLADQHHVSVVEIEEYIKKVIEDLRKSGQFELEKLQAWQLVERDYIKQLIAQYKNGLSTAEYEEKLLKDRLHLNQLADQYRVNVEQIEKWMIEELKRLRNDSEKQIQQLTVWQTAEVERLKQLIKEQNHLTYVDFEVELQNERARLENLAKQYSLNVEQIETWLREQLINLKARGEIKVESLTKWQEEEQKNLIELLLKQQNVENYESFERQLHQDHDRLQTVSQRYHVSIEQIEQWMRDELQRLKGSGLMQFEQLNYWQRDTRDRLENWIKQHNNDTSYEEFLEFLRRDKARLASIANDYHITVEEVEKWVQKEGARLQVLGNLERPQSQTTIEEFYKIWENKNTDNNNGANLIIADNEELWKQQTFAHFKALATYKPMTWTQFETYLTENRPRWEQFARQYDITVEDIEVWLRECAHKQPQGAALIIEEWQESEQRHIQDLLNQLLRKQQKWTIEDLEIQLINDRIRLQQLATQYHITVEEIETWYKTELQRLLNERRIISGNLQDWQRREKERIYTYVKQRPGLSVQILEQQIFRDRPALEQLALEYHITVEELTIFIRNELGRLVNIGLITNTGRTSSTNNWQAEERQRLRQIATDITITEEELVQFISNDKNYQDRLAHVYGVSLEVLAPFQRTEILTLANNHYLQHIKLNTLQPWQIRERDRLYDLIKNQNFSLRNLRDWQHQDMYLNELAHQYGISVYELKEWQLHEFERIMQIAEHYKMSLYELQNFRDKELRYITYIMHKKTSTANERHNWENNEAARYRQLSQRYEISEEELIEWRRTLYLLAQGLIDLNVSGGGVKPTPVSPPKQIISKDRGDQPPHLYEEEADGEEPGIEGEVRKPAHIIEATTRANYYLPPVTPQPSGVQSGYRYSKKEYKVTVPAGGSASATATADANSSSASATIGGGGGGGSFNGFESQSHTKENYGQQQQQEEVEDFGQQQQVELGWNSKLQESEDLGQQQVQIEDLSGFGIGAGSANAHGSYTAGQQQQQQQSSDEYGQQQVQIEDLSGFGIGAGAGNAHGSYTAGHNDYGQQQVQVEDLHDFGQQQQQQEELLEPIGQQGSNSQRQVQANVATKPHVEVQAEPEPTGLWGKFKKKTTDFFG